MHQTLRAMTAPKPLRQRDGSTGVARVAVPFKLLRETKKTTGCYFAALAVCARCSPGQSSRMRFPRCGRHLGVWKWPTAHEGFRRTWKQCSIRTLWEMWRLIDALDPLIKGDGARAGDLLIKRLTISTPLSPTAPRTWPAIRS